MLLHINKIFDCHALSGMQCAWTLECKHHSNRCMHARAHFLYAAIGVFCGETRPMSAASQWLKKNITNNCLNDMSVNVCWYWFHVQCWCLFLSSCEMQDVATSCCWNTGFVFPTAFLVHGWENGCGSETGKACEHATQWKRQGHNASRVLDAEATSFWAALSFFSLAYSSASICSVLAGEKKYNNIQ